MDGTSSAPTEVVKQDVQQTKPSRRERNKQTIMENITAELNKIATQGDDKSVLKTLRGFQKRVSKLRGGHATTRKPRTAAQIASTQKMIAAKKAKLKKQN